MTELLQQVLDGLSSGLVYGMLALALSVVFQGTGMLNFSQGEMATLSAYVTLVYVFFFGLYISINFSIRASGTLTTAVCTSN